MTRRGFVRVIFGTMEQGNPKRNRRRKIGGEIQFALCNPHLPEFTAYVLGQENFQALSRAGVRCLLVTPDPSPFAIPAQFYRNRLEGLLAAAKDFDEFVALDWDCFPVKPVPEDFWRQLGRKAPFQAPLYAYRHERCSWRDRDRNLVPNGGFLYFREAAIVEQMARLWESLDNQALDEVCMAKWVDESMDGWKGKEAYFRQFEPIYNNTGKTHRLYPAEWLREKNEVFLHSSAVARHSPIAAP